jgi:hypothetical protein
MGHPAEPGCPEYREHGIQLTDLQWRRRARHHVDDRAARQPRPPGIVNLGMDHLPIHLHGIALVVLGSPQWPVLRVYVQRVVAAVNRPARAVTRKLKYLGFNRRYPVLLTPFWSKNDMTIQLGRGLARDFEGSAYQLLPVSYGSASLAGALPLAGAKRKGTWLDGAMLAFFGRATRNGSKPLWQWCALQHRSLAWFQVPCAKQWLTAGDTS